MTLLLPEGCAGKPLIGYGSKRSLETRALKVEGGVEVTAWTRRAALTLSMMAVLVTADATACNVTLRRDGATSQYIATMLAKRNAPCRSTNIDGSEIKISAGGVMQAPKRGRLTVLVDPGYEYLSTEIGDDTFVVIFYGHDRSGRAGSIAYRVSVETKD